MKDENRHSADSDPGCSLRLLSGLSLIFIFSFSSIFFPVAVKHVLLINAVIGLVFFLRIPVRIFVFKNTAYPYIDRKRVDMMKSEQ